MDSFYTEEELRQLGFRQVGTDVKVSRKTSIYQPERISLGNHVRIDDFCCLVGGAKGIEIGSYVHIAFFCVILGRGGVVIEDFAGLSSRCALYSATDDFSGQFLTNPTVPVEYLNVQEGQIVVGRHAIVGTGATILPGVTVGEGCAIGAHSLVTKTLEPWGVYFGSPVKRIKRRSQDLLVLEQALINRQGI